MRSPKMQVTSKAILKQLEDLQSNLDKYSFDELSIEEAGRLKLVFETFRQGLERKIWSKGGEEGTLSAPIEVDKAHRYTEDIALIARVSHELRTPLNGILGFADLLSENPLNSQQQEYVRAIQSASRSLLDHSNELLEYSKLRANTTRIEKISFKPHQILQEIKYLCEILIVDERIQLNFNTHGKLPDTLVGDPTRLSQILINLLGNAIKYGKSSTIALDVRIQRFAEECILHFEVADNGSGIPLEEQDKIFEPYHQLKQHRNVSDGSGLGLSIVKAIVEQQGGEIHLKSKVGFGTTFYISLPYKIGLDESARIEQKPAASPEKDLKGMRVLIFEDNDLNRKLLHTRLTAWGCVVYAAETATKGLIMLQELQIDLILMDLRMPELDGYEATKRIRNHRLEALRNIPVIAVTADITAGGDERGAAAGINDFLLKPYVPEELKRKLGHYYLKEQVSSAVPTVQVESNRSLSLEPLLEECMGDIEMLEELLQLFRANILEFIGNMKLHIQQFDTNSISFASHKIKAGLKLLGTQRLLDPVLEIHRIAQDDGNLKVIDDMFGRFVNVYPEVEAQIEEALNEIKNRS